MSAAQLLTLVSLTLGAAAILRFIWLDSLRFADPTARVASSNVTRATAQRLAMQAEAARVHAETENLPKAA